MDQFKILCQKEFRYFDSSPSIVAVAKPDNLRQVEHVAHMVEAINIQEMLLWKFIG
jgi:hypothetical protein